ncbi:MAG: VOC family protein [Bacilli bacterium]
MKILQTYVRIYVTELDSAIAFYESLTGQQTDLRFPYPETGLELASVGPFLILAGSDEALSPFRETLATFRVDSVEEFREHLTKNGARIIRDIRRVPTGSNMTVHHPDGTRFEYVQHHI